MGADFGVDLKPGGAMTWSGPGKDGKPMRYVTGEVLRVEAPRLFEYRFGMGDGAVMSKVKVELGTLGLWSSYLCLMTKPRLSGRLSRPSIMR
jgi:uncharacterized protein YndB with AHSA1/START domain